MATTYNLNVGGIAVGFARSTKATVVAKAEETRKGGEKSAITVTTDAGNVVFELKAAKQRLITKKTKPFTKVVELPEALLALVPDGYVAAYTRPRNDAAVLRNEGAEDEERYAVSRLSTGEFLGFAGTTREAGAIMKAEKVVKVNA